MIVQMISRRVLPCVWRIFRSSAPFFSRNLTIETMSAPCTSTKTMMAITRTRFHKLSILRARGPAGSRVFWGSSSPHAVAQHGEAKCNRGHPNPAATAIARCGHLLGAPPAFCLGLPGAPPKPPRSSSRSLTATVPRPGAIVPGRCRSMK